MNESFVDDDFIRNAIDKYSDTVFRVSYQYVRNKQDAEDILQEVLLALLTCLRQTDFDSDEHMKAWLIRVAINKSINTLKNNAKRRKKEAAIFTSQEIRIDPQYDDLDFILSKLSATDREIIYLRYYEGYTAKEIAILINMTEKAVFKRLSRARIKLKDFITEGGF